MRAAIRRLHRLEDRLLPPAETKASRLYYETMLAVSRNRARRLGQPLPDKVPGLEWTRNISSLAEIIRVSRERCRARQAKEAGRSLTPATDTDRSAGI